MWFDDLYHPDGDLFLEAFGPPERDRLARFNAFYIARVDGLPDTLERMPESAAWHELMAEARRVMDDLGWRDPES